jgi:hypothetical protein
MRAFKNTHHTPYRRIFRYQPEIAFARQRKLVTGRGAMPRFEIQERVGVVASRDDDEGTVFLLLVWSGGSDGAVCGLEGAGGDVVVVFEGFGRL